MTQKKLLLVLLSYPLLMPLLSLLVAAGPAQAREFVFEAPQSPSACDRPSRMNNLTCVKGQRYQPSSSAAPGNEVPMLEFSEEESEAAIAKFGCDCIACINAIRQSRGLPPVT